jgi:predicted kinase
MGLPKVSITVGLPGSGKTTQALLIQAKDPLNTMLVSRDDLRMTLFHDEGILEQWQENHISKVQKDIVKGAIKAGKHIIIHDLNLREKYRKEWAEIAHNHGAEFDIIDCTQIGVDDCVANDGLRGLAGGRSVGPEVIRNLALKFKSTLHADTWKPYKLYPPVAFSAPVSYEKVEWVPGLPEAIIVDVDGTVADCKGVRSPYDETKYHLDKPKAKVIRLVQDHAYRLDQKVIFVSGRHKDGREVTEEWLFEHVKVPVEGLYMRYERGTEDSVIKAELFNQNIRGKYNIVCVYDDRNRVVEMWRSMGLLVCQVAKGDF